MAEKHKLTKQNVLQNTIFNKYKQTTENNQNINKVGPTYPSSY